MYTLLLVRLDANNGPDSRLEDNISSGDVGIIMQNAHRYHQPL